MTFGGTIPIRIIEPKTWPRLGIMVPRISSTTTTRLVFNELQPISSSRKLESKFADNSTKRGEGGRGKENAGGGKEER